MRPDRGILCDLALLVPAFRAGAVVALGHQKIAIAPRRLDQAEPVPLGQILPRLPQRLAGHDGPFDVAHAVGFVDQRRQEMQAAADPRFHQPHQPVAPAVHRREMAFGFDRRENGRGAVRFRTFGLHPFLRQPVQRAADFFFQPPIRGPRLPIDEEADRLRGDNMAQGVGDGEVGVRVLADPFGQARNSRNAIFSDRRANAPCFQQLRAVNEARVTFGALFRHASLRLRAAA